VASINSAIFDDSELQHGFIAARSIQWKTQNRCNLWSHFHSYGVNWPSFFLLTSSANPAASNGHYCRPIGNWGLQVQHLNFYISENKLCILLQLVQLLYRRFPDRRFPGNHFPGQDVSRKDVSRTTAYPNSSIISRTRRFPDNHFPGQTFPGQFV